MKNKFVFLGDSLTFGYGIHNNKGWVYLISENSNELIINKGINGDTTTLMLDRFYDDVTCNSPNKIFIMGGTNDLLLGHSIDSIIANLDQLIKDSLKITSEVYIGIPPYILKEMANKLFIPSPFYTYCEEYLPVLRNKIIDLCNVYKIKYLDFYTITKDNANNNIFSDGIHLNFPGNTLLYNIALEVFNRN